MFNKFKKNKASKVDLTPKEPRQLAEITKEYNQAAFEAGNAQYQMYIHGENLALLNKKLLQLNQEAGRRTQIDAEAKKNAPTGSSETPKDKA